MPGTYQAIDAPAGEETSVEVQPTRSVRARAMDTSVATMRELDVYILMRDYVVTEVVIVRY